MLVTNETIDIACSPKDAFALISNPAKGTSFFVSLKEVRNHHGGQVQVGDHWSSVNQFMGREIPANMSVLEAAAPNKLVLSNTSDSAEIEITWFVEPIDGGTRITFHSEGTPKGFFATLASNLVKGNYDQSVRDSLENLKSVLEG